jgi:replicative DNA helicase
MVWLPRSLVTRNLLALKEWDMSQISWEARVSALTLEASEMLRRLSEPAVAGDKVKAQISRAARAAGLSYWRAFDLWYGKARRIDAHELDAIRLAQASRQQRSGDRAHELKTIAEELEAIAGRLSRLGSPEARTDLQATRAVLARVRNLD